jgi:hypothetical protein
MNADFKDFISKVKIHITSKKIHKKEYDQVLDIETPKCKTVVQLDRTTYRTNENGYLSYTFSVMRGMPDKPRWLCKSGASSPECFRDSVQADSFVLKID